MILHVDLDAFFASVEQAKDPRLRGRPVVVGGKPDEASVIASCSYEARRYGLHAGMPLRQAARLCPRAVFLTGSYPEYRRVSDKVFSILSGFSPVVEIASLDEAYADLEGTESLHGSAWRVARRLRRKIHETTGLSATVGLGSSRILAKLATACAKPDGIGLLFPDRATRFLQTLPLSALPGIGRKTQEVFRRLNLDSVGDLARIPEDLLVATIGKRGKTLFRLARGKDARPLDPNRRPRSVSRRSAFLRPTADAAILKGYLFYLCERAALGLRTAGACAETVAVSLEYDDYKRREGAAALPEPTDLAASLYRTAEPLFRRLHDRRVRIRRVGVEARRLLFSAPRQKTLFSTERERDERLAKAVEAIRRRHGFSGVVCGPSLALLNELPKDEHGFRLRTASLTR